MPNVNTSHSSSRSVLRIDITVSQNPVLCVKTIQIYNGLAASWWFFRIFSSTNKTDRHDKTEILLKVVLNTIMVYNTSRPFSAFTLAIII
jgi:hypothetical protein